MGFYSCHCLETPQTFVSDQQTGQRKRFWALQAAAISVLKIEGAQEESKWPHSRLEQGKPDRLTRMQDARGLAGGGTGKKQS